MLSWLNFRRHTFRLPISDYQARGAGLSKSPSVFSATNIPMTRFCTKPWKFTNNHHGTDTPCATLPPTLSPPTHVTSTLSTTSQDDIWLLNMKRHAFVDYLELVRSVI
jgi:hypothetical protein